MQNEHREANEGRAQRARPRIRQIDVLILRCTPVCPLSSRSLTEAGRCGGAAAAMASRSPPRTGTNFTGGRARRDRNIPATCLSNARTTRAHVGTQLRPHPQMNRLRQWSQELDGQGAVDNMRAAQTRRDGLSYRMSVCLRTMRCEVREAQILAQLPSAFQA